MKDNESLAVPLLRDISTAIARERNVGKLLPQVLEIAEKRLGMVRGTIALLAGDELRIEASTRTLNAEERALGRYRIGEGITGLVAKTGRAEVVPDVRKDPRFLNRTKARGKGDAVSFVCVPLVHGGQVVGTLSADREIREGDRPLDEAVELLGIVANVVGEAASAYRQQRAEREALVEENRKLRSLLSESPGRLIGDCPEMREVYAQIRQVAPTEATVLVRGASGTGKELVARAIQSLSPRKDRPFVVLNCAALPEALVESELFGHERGAFTDARERRIGRAEAADGGTLFLDEIGDLSIPIQIKLLRFLQERTFSRIGSNEELHSNVRFIAATSRNLEELMAKKLFREDLYYRLSVFPITMPDLSRRTGDIVLLAEHFLAKMNVKYGKQVTRISPPAVSMLQSYSWPGNVRELENCIERAVLTATDDCVHGYNLPPSLQAPEFAEDPYRPDATMTLDEQLAAFEKRVLEDALLRHGGNRSAAGRELGVSPRMMNYRLNRLGISG
jgi:Nif-specific regulatory protein